MLLVTLTFYGIEIFFINILIFCNSFMVFIQCEIESLKRDLENFLVDNDSIKKRIFKIVRIHNKGIELAEKLESALNLLMLVLYTVNTLVLCFLFFEFHIVTSFILFLINSHTVFTALFPASQRLHQLAEGFDFLCGRSDAFDSVFLLRNEINGRG